MHSAMPSVSQLTFSVGSSLPGASAWTQGIFAGRRGSVDDGNNIPRRQCRRGDPSRPRIPGAGPHAQRASGVGSAFGRAPGKVYGVPDRRRQAATLNRFCCGFPAGVPRAADGGSTGSRSSRRRRGNYLVKAL